MSSSYSADGVRRERFLFISNVFAAKTFSKGCVENCRGADDLFGTIFAEEKLMLSALVDKSHKLNLPPYMLFVGLAFLYK